MREKDGSEGTPSIKHGCCTHPVRMHGQPGPRENAIKVKDARGIAHEWVAGEASKIPGFYAAYFAGSTNWMSGEAPLPPASDVDIAIVLDGPATNGSFRKFHYRDVLLEVSYATSDQFQSPEQVLSSYYRAAHFTRDCVIADPYGQLAKIQVVVTRDFARRTWVQSSCENAQDWLVTSMGWFDPSAALHDQVFACLYPASVLTHMVLVAALQNPGGPGKMILASREVLARYGDLPVHEAILGSLGLAELRRAQVEAMFASCAEVYGVARATIKTPFFGSSGITELDWSAARDATIGLIEQGLHREAAFGTLLLHTLCQKALHNDASLDTQQVFLPSYRRLLSDIGMSSTKQMQARLVELRRYLPVARDVCWAIIEANPDVED